MKELRHAREEQTDRKPNKRNHKTQTNKPQKPKQPQPHNFPLQQVKQVKQVRQKLRQVRSWSSVATSGRHSSRRWDHTNISRTFAGEGQVPENDQANQTTNQHKNQNPTKTNPTTPRGKCDSGFKTCGENITFQNSLTKLWPTHLLNMASVQK